MSFLIIQDKFNGSSSNVSNLPYHGPVNTSDLVLTTSMTSVFPLTLLGLILSSVGIDLVHFEVNSSGPNIEKCRQESGL